MSAPPRPTIDHDRTTLALARAHELRAVSVDLAARIEATLRASQERIRTTRELLRRLEAGIELRRPPEGRPPTR